MNVFKTGLCVRIISMIWMLVPATAFSANYYISNSGNDANTGLSPAQAWKSIDKLNIELEHIRPGDSIFFKRSESFYGSIKVRRSGSKDSLIVFAAYGKGAAPVISGFTSVTHWVKKDGNIWEAPAPLAKSSANVVLLDTVLQQIGRYPNADAGDDGYLRYEDFNANRSITDNQLSAAINWTGAEVVIRKNHWTAERCRITSQQGNTIFYTYAHGGINRAIPSVYPGTKGNGYFFQKDARTLDQQGEWFFDSTNGNLQLFFSGSDLNGHTVKISTVDTLLNTGNFSFIGISGLAFEGANLSAVYNRDGGNISITDCSFKNIGAKAIHFWETGNVLVDHVNISNVLSNAIQIRNGRKDNVTVRNCVVKNTGVFIGMGSFFDDRDYKAIVATARKNLLIENNMVERTGLTGIQFQGDEVTVQHNVVNNYCFNLDDGAGIYTYVDATKEKPGLPYSNRIVKENIILNGKGASQAAGGLGRAEGIYLDNGSMGVEITGNTIAHVSNKAIALNNPFEVKITNNTCFDNGSGWSASRRTSWQEFGKLDITHNIFYALLDHQVQGNFLYAGLDQPDGLTIWEAIKLAGNIDSNYYNIANPLAFNYTFSQVEGKPMNYPSPLTLEHWQDFTGQDLHSKKPAKLIPVFLFRQKLGKNLVNNGDFAKDLTDVKVEGSDTKGKWDDDGAITGKGSLRIEFGTAEPNHYSLVHGEAGSIMAGKKYMLRFNTLGKSDCGIVRAYLRRTLPPFDKLSPVQTGPFGAVKKLHEFLLEPAISANADFVIEFEKNACTLYLDDVELYEADAKRIQGGDFVRFEVNPTDKPVEIALDKKYTTVDGTVYNGVITLPAFSSKILIADVTE